MPFVVYSQTAVKVNWERVDSSPETVGKLEKRFVGDEHTRNKVIKLISERTGIPMEDLALKKEVYFKNDKTEASFHYTDRDNACLVVDLQLRPNLGKYITWIGDGPYARMYPHYSVEKVQ